MTFKKENSFENRLSEASRIREKYPNLVPVIVERAESCTNVPKLDKKKYLVPEDLTIGQFMYVVRKRIKLTPEKAIFMFVNGTLIPTGAIMSTLYESDQNKDGFLYFIYSGENTFG